ncbi:hypothetical protein [Heyndrickxia camelliae]|uniref:Uncharacterized protein n=1 Tax=Heyndrickxia camelliae TaxID=1707093 RepID=A0A2N3LML1_9BACI|nr:hypothetical protein [Heyndrickxia camelliae]PKR85871.1 hypothetical protein CWO92_05735 [Heyndrickxia camelliae]
MIEKNEVLQMLEELDQMIFEIEKKMESRMDIEKSNAARQVELGYQQLEKKIASIEEKLYKNPSYTIIPSLA